MNEWKHAKFGWIYDVYKGKCVVSVLMADKQKQNLISHIRQLSVLAIVSTILQLASYYPAAPHCPTCSCC